MAQRSDGTWVMYFKAIDQEEVDACEECDDSAQACTSAAAIKDMARCTECARNIYRSETSIDDLVDWSTPAMTPVVESASVPEAYTDRAGRVWLYWQDFTGSCAAPWPFVPSERAAILTAWEQDDYELSAVQRVSFPDEDFETDTGLHYATNPNPARLPDEDAIDELEACPL